MVLESHFSGHYIRCSFHEHQKYVRKYSTVHDMGRKTGDKNKFILLLQGFFRLELVMQ